MPEIQKNEPKDLMNIGPETLEYLKLLNIETIEQLSTEDPDHLYLELNQLTETQHEYHVWDIFAALIDEAKNGKQMPWWEWTKVRKRRLREGSFCAE